jgi:hypothetical protein
MIPINDQVLIRSYAKKFLVLCWEIYVPSMTEVRRAVVRGLIIAAQIAVCGSSLLRCR